MWHVQATLGPAASPLHLQLLPGCCSQGGPLSLQPSDVQEQPLEQLQSQLQVSPEDET